MGNHPFKDSNLTKKEINRLRKIIKDVKGKQGDELNEEEFKVVFGRWLHKSQSDLEPVDIAQIFSACDTDKSGTVNTKELVAWLSIYQKGSTEEKLMAVFELFDADGNGVLTGEEIEQVLKSLHFSITSRGLSQSKALDSAQEKVHKLLTGHGVITKEQWLKIGKKTNLIEDLLGPEFVRLMDGN
eukprot:TRINITY_DN4791_c0_g1_i1.p1 TRINITY_DN4791_c0_g1~~TRINITY_DN4791_c0_g1_i1.p1  ORF type:complete len:185 (-),score=52.92 TRINITY_DN4791_c0_g1_i1:121-675(-)